MANKFLLLLSFLSAVATALSQEISRKDADSMLMALNKSKRYIDRIDLLLNLAKFHIFKPGESEIDFDSALTLINKAKSLNETVKSSTTNGYILLTESYITREQENNEESKKMTEQAVAILEPGSNKTYLGKAYYQLSTYYDYADSQQYMPVHMKDKKPGSLGMSLMAGLSEDLDGKFTIENTNGTLIRISFMHDTRVKRADILATSLVSNN